MGASHHRLLALLEEFNLRRYPTHYEGEGVFLWNGVAQWLERQGAGELASYPLAWLTRMGGSGGFEAHESSILHLAWTQAVAPQHETPEAWLVEGGIARVAERLAAELAGLIQLAAPVMAIRQQGAAPSPTSSPPAPGPATAGSGSSPTSRWCGPAPRRPAAGQAISRERSRPAWP